MQQQPQLSVDGFSSHIAGMSKKQLHEIMSQMKGLIDQNQQQARQILIDNPLLTRSLFQAQIILGMVQPPKVLPNIQRTLTQPQSAQVGQPSNHQTTQSLQVQVQGGLQGQASSPQPLVPSRQKQQPIQPFISIPTSVPPLTFQPQSMAPDPSHAAQQSKGFLNAQVPIIATQQVSQTHHVPMPPPPAPPHYSILQSNMPMSSSQAQQSLQIPGLLHQPTQPPLPQQPRPPSMQPFSHQLHSQMHNSHSFQPSSAPQPLLSQPLFHSGGNPQPSFPQGQPPTMSHPPFQQHQSPFQQLQPPFQQLYQVGSYFGQDYGNQAGTSMQADRGPWAPGLTGKGPTGHQMAGPPPSISEQMVPGTSGQPRPPPLTPEMEQALLHQVMSLTPEQINLLPPEQRQQVIQLQGMLR